MKYTAWASCLIGSITTEEMKKMPKKFKDPENPTNEELTDYFEDQQQELAGSNSGSEELANADLDFSQSEEDEESSDPTAA